MKNVFLNKKLFIRFFTLFFVFLTIFSLCSMSVNAENVDADAVNEDGKLINVKCQLCGQTHDFTTMYERDTNPFLNLPGGRTLAYYIACWAYGDIFSDPNPFAKSSNMDITSIIKFDVSEAFVTDESGEPVLNPDGSVETQVTGSWGDLFTVASNFYDTMGLFACLIILIYFIVDLSDEYLIRDGYTLETFAKRAIGVIVIFLIIKNGLVLLQMLMNLNTAIVNDLLVAGTAAKPYMFAEGSCVFDTLMDAGDIAIFTILGQIIKYAMPAIISLITYIILRISLYGRLIEIAVRVLFAPIGMADMAHGGLNSNGVKYLRKLFSCCLQGAIIIVIIIAYRTISISIQNSIAGMFGVVLVGLATITGIKQVQAIANDVVGL